MTDWSISKRIATISMFLMGTLLLTAAMGIFSTMRTGGLFADYRAATAQVILAADIAKDLAEAQLGETRFRSGGSEEHAAEVTANLDEVRAAEVAFLALFDQDEELRQIARAIQEDTETFHTTFHTIRGLQNERNGHTDQIVILGPQIRKMMNALSTTLIFDGNTRAINGLADSLQDYLLTRIYVERFLLTNSARDFQIAEEHHNLSLAKLQDAASTTTVAARITEFEAISELMQTFWTSALAARSVIERRNAHRVEIDDLAATLSGNIDAIVTTIVPRQANLGSSSERTKSITLTVLIGFSIVAQIASFLFARRIAAETTRAIGVSVNQMRELAGGNLELEITGMEQEHELGEMARALEIFRNSGRAAHELERQQKLRDAETRRKEAEAAKLEAANDAERNRKIEEARRSTIRELCESVGVVVEAGAEGDFSRRIKATFDEKELNDLAHSINDLIGNVQTGVAETARVMARIATGDLSDRMQGNFKGTFAELKSNVNETIDTLGNLVVRISSQCDSLGGASTRMTEQANELARRAEQQAASLEETSAAMEEISASARSSAEGASTAAEFAKAASVRVDDAGQVVAAAVNAMADIRDASNRINEIVSVIDGIAFQTNLLALNASVEAARAGPAGKGFAVVATEVRALAQRSSEASKDIKGLIDESANQVRKGVELVEQTGQTLEEIMGGVGQMASTMQELTTTAREQATGVSEVTSAISQLDSITQKNAALSERSREAASEVRGEADAMRGLVASFRTERSPQMQNQEKNCHRRGIEPLPRC